MSLHPASYYGDDAHGISRDQNIKREEDSSLYVTVPIQDVRRLLADDPDPELRDRVEDQIRYEVERLYDDRNFGT